MTEFLQPYDYVERNATERPSDVAMSDGDQNLSWSGLRDLTKRIARELRDRGVTPGDVVGFRLPPYLNSVLALGVFHEAAVYAPFNLDMVNDTTVDFALVVSNKPIDGWPAERTLVVSNSWFEKIHMNSTIIDQKRYAEDDGVMRHALTSGTTKRARTIRFGWLTTAARATRQLELTPGAHQHMSLIGGRSEGGINQLVISLITGNPYLVPNTPAQNVTLINRFEVDVLRGSPNQYRELVRELERTDQKLPSVTTILTLGAAMSKGVSEKLLGLTGAKAVGNSYAATEVGSMCIRFGNSDDPQDMGEIRDGTEFQVVDVETHEPVPDGVVGAVRARREHMATEYFNDPEETAKHFRDGWFYPGDLGVLNGRRFTLHGRLSEIINAGGSKIDPATIDEVCNSIPNIDDCAAFGLVDESGATVVALAYVSTYDLDARLLHNQVREQLGHRTPVRFVRVAEIPRTETGKVARNALATRFAAKVGTGNAPRNDDASEATPEGFVQPFEFVKRGWQADPEAPAVIGTDFTLTRAQLYFGAKQFAGLLRQHGVAPGDVVAIDVTGPAQYQLTFAILHEAAVATSFLPMMLAEGSQDVHWIVSNRRYNTWPAERQIVLDSTLIESVRRFPRDIQPRVYPSAESTMRLAFSSGTTGRPKAIPFSVFSATERAKIHHKNDFSETQMLSLMPARLGMGWHWLYASTIAQIPFLAPGTPEENVRLAERYGVDSIIGSPVQLSDFCDEHERLGIALPELRVAASSGSALPEKLAHRITEQLGAQVIVTYGSTEVGHIAKRDNDVTDPAYLGDVMTEVAQAEIVDPDTDEVLPDGEIGVMRTRGDSMVSGYGNRDDDAGSFRDGWFYPGDMGYKHGNALYMAGRVSELINVGGAKVDPSAIDAYFVKLGVFEDVAAFPLADDSGIDRVAIAYIPRGPVDVSEIIANARKALATFTPTHAYRVDRIPRNESGKIMRKNLTEWVARRFGDDRGENR